MSTADDGDKRIDFLMLLSEWVVLENFFSRKAAKSAKGSDTQERITLPTGLISFSPENQLNFSIICLARYSLISLCRGTG
jgi:hypothetical protein